MAIKLKQNTFEELVQVTEEILLSSEVHSGLFISLKSIDEFSRCDAILAKHGETSKYLAKFIDERPFQSFANEWLSRELYSRGNYEPNSPTKQLLDMKGFSDPAIVAREMVHGLCQLPIKYKFTLQLMSTLDFLLPAEVDEFTLSDKLRLVRVTDELKQEFKVSAAHGSAFDGEPAKNKLLIASGVTHTEKGKICLQYEGEGEIGLTNKFAVEKSAEAAFKTFFGIALALGLVEKVLYINTTQKSDTVYIHTPGDAGWEFVTVGTIEASLTENLSLIAINSFMKSRNSHKPEAYADWCYKCLLSVRTCFSDHEGAERIRLAAQWLFDSYGGSNQLLSFVQATICMEILFGTGDKDFSQGLVNIMKNRCAYLIGTSHKERKTIMDQFASIYKVRSTIVHTGQNELSRSEAEMLYTLRGMCDRAIAAEIKLISADNVGTLGALFALGSAMDQR